MIDAVVVLACTVTILAAVIASHVRLAAIWVSHARRIADGGGTLSSAHAGAPAPRARTDSKHGYVQVVTSEWLPWARLTVAGCAWFGAVALTAEWHHTVCFASPPRASSSTSDGIGAKPLLEVEADAFGALQLWDTHRQSGHAVFVRHLIAAENLTMWAPQTIAAHHGDTEVDTRRSNGEHGAQDVVSTTVAAFVESAMTPRRLRSEEAADDNSASAGQYYIAENDFLADAYREEARSLGLRHVVPNTWLRRTTTELHTYVWMGPAGSRTGLHADPDPLNVLLQLHGSKTVVLFPADTTDEATMYPSSRFDDGATVSMVDPFQPDLTRYPRYPGDAGGVAVHLEAGDALYVPMGWYHYAEAQSPSVSLSVRALTPCESVASVTAWVLRALHDVGLYKRGDCVCHTRAADS